MYENLEIEIDVGDAIIISYLFEKIMCQVLFVFQRLHWIWIAPLTSVILICENILLSTWRSYWLNFLLLGSWNSAQQFFLVRLHVFKLSMFDLCIWISFELWGRVFCFWCIHRFEMWLKSRKLGRNWNLLQVAFFMNVIKTIFRWTRNDYIGKAVYWNCCFCQLFCGLMCSEALLFN